MSAGIDQSLTVEEVLALPAVVDLKTACRALQVGMTVGYELARNGEFPCDLLRLGRQYRVPTASLRRVLGLTAPAPVTPGS